MSFTTLRRLAYRLSALLGLVYVVYVVTLKLMARPTGGPLGEVGEFLLVLGCVTAFAIGLFIDEAHAANEETAEQVGTSAAPTRITKETA